jgi:hypothetical protein
MSDSSGINHTQLFYTTAEHQLALILFFLEGLCVGGMLFKVGWTVDGNVYR